MDYEALYLIIENSQTLSDAEIDEMDEIRRISEASDNVAADPPILFTTTM